jgi:hypothetical protein
VFNISYLGANKWKTYLDKFGIHQPTHLPTVFLLDGPAEMYWQPAHLKDAASGPMSSFDDVRLIIVFTLLMNYQYSFFLFVCTDSNLHQSGVRG